MKKANISFKLVAIALSGAILVSSVSYYCFGRKELSYASIINLPLNGEGLTPKFNQKPYHLPIMKGIAFNPQDPENITFYIDRKGKKKLPGQEIKRILKYFLGFLTIPEEKLWVNLSPYEPDRIMPEIVAESDIGRDMILEDYLLKQLTASVTNPTTITGRKFWEQVNQACGRIAGCKRIPVDSQFKVWIVPDLAEIVENSKPETLNPKQTLNPKSKTQNEKKTPNMAFVKKARLKVLMENDMIRADTRPAPTENYGQLPIQGRGGPCVRPNQKNKKIQQINQKAQEIFKRTLLPIIEDQVNNGATFAPLRQMYYSLILANYFKDIMRQDPLYGKYIDKGKSELLKLPDGLKIRKQVYNRYIDNIKNGTYKQKINNRIYTCGGSSLSGVPINKEQLPSKDILAENKDTLEIHAKPEFHKNGDTSPEKLIRLPDDNDQLHSFLPLLYTGGGVLFVGITSYLIYKLIIKIQQRSPNNTDTVSSYMKLLKSDDPFNVNFAARELGKLGSSRPVPELILLLKHYEYSVRSSAAEALGKIKDPQAVPELKTLLNKETENEESVREAAAKALGEIKDKDAIRVLTNSLAEDTYIIRSAAATALGKIKDREATYALLKSLKEEDHLYLRRDIAEILGTTKDKEAISGLIQALSDDPENIVRNAAVGALATFQDNKEIIVPVLLKIFDNKNEYVRRTATLALGVLNDPRAVPTLIELLDDKDIYSAANRALNTFSRHLITPAIPKFIKLLDDKDEYVRQFAALNLGKTQTKQAVPKLIQLLLEDTKYSVRHYAAKALGEIKDKRATDALIKTLLNDNDSETDRGEAAEALRKIRDKNAIPALIKILEKEPSGHVRWTAARAVRDIQDSRAVKILIKSLKDKHDWVRFVSSQALGNIADKRAIGALLKTMKTDTNKYVRSNAAWALGKTNSKKAEALLINYLKKGNKHNQNILSNIQKMSQLSYRLVKKIKEIDDKQILTAIDIAAVLEHINWIIKIKKTSDKFYIKQFNKTRTKYKKLTELFSSQRLSGGKIHLDIVPESKEGMFLQYFCGMLGINIQAHAWEDQHSCLEIHLLPSNATVAVTSIIKNLLSSDILKLFNLLEKKDDKIHLQQSLEVDGAFWNEQGLLHTEAKLLGLSLFLTAPMKIRSLPDTIEQDIDTWSILVEGGGGKYDEKGEDKPESYDKKDRVDLWNVIIATYLDLMKINTGEKAHFEKAFQQYHMIGNAITVYLKHRGNLENLNPELQTIYKIGRSFSRKMLNLMKEAEFFEGLIEKSWQKNNWQHTKEMLLKTADYKGEIKDNAQIILEETILTLQLLKFKDYIGSIDNNQEEIFETLEDIIEASDEISLTRDKIFYGLRLTIANALNDDNKYASAETLKAAIKDRCEILDINPRYMRMMVKEETEDDVEEMQEDQQPEDNLDDQSDQQKNQQQEDNSGEEWKNGQKTILPEHKQWEENKEKQEDGDNKNDDSFHSFLPLFYIGGGVLLAGLISYMVYKLLTSMIQDRNDPYVRPNQKKKKTDVGTGQIDNRKSKIERKI